MIEKYRVTRDYDRSKIKAKFVYDDDGKSVCKINMRYDDNDIIAVMPLKEGCIICNDVLTALNNQSVKIGILPVTRPKEGFRGGISRTFCKNTGKELALQLFDHDLFLFLNSDIVFRSQNGVQDMISFLEENKDYGAVAIQKSKRVSSDHIDIGCMTVRREVMKHVDFTLESTDHPSCDCRNFERDMQTIGYKMGYLKDQTIVDLYKESS